MHTPPLYCYNAYTWNRSLQILLLDRQLIFPTLFRCGKNPNFNQSERPHLWHHYRQMPVLNTDDFKMLYELLVFFNIIKISLVQLCININSFIIFLITYWVSSHAPVRLPSRSALAQLFSHCSTAFSNMPSYKTHACNCNQSIMNQSINNVINRPPFNYIIII